MARTATTTDTGFLGRLAYAGGVGIGATQGMLSILGQLGGGLRNAWPFGPSNPLTPSGTPAEMLAGPRAWDYPMGWNLIFQPKGEAEQGAPFQTLREFSELDTVIRICIQHQIREMVGVGWHIEAKVKGDGDKYVDDIAEVTAFFEKPDKENDFPTWLAMNHEEMLVTDSLCLHPEPDKAGRLYALEAIDGTTMKPCIDVRGRVQAYEQNIMGLPRTAYLSPYAWDKGRKNPDDPDQVMYKPRNKRKHGTVYGYSPVEQALLVSNLAMAEFAYNEGYFTEGNIPDAIINVREGMSDDARQQLEQQFNEDMVGNTKMRRRLRFLPAGMSGFVQLKPYEYNRDLAWLLIQLRCGVLGVNPNNIGFTESSNKAVAETQMAAQYKRTLKPDAEYWANILTDAIAMYMGKPFLRFVFDLKEEERELTIDEEVKLVSAGMKGTDEWREENGYTPLGVPVSFATASGPVALMDFFDGTAQAAGVSTPAGEANAVSDTAADSAPGDTPDAADKGNEDIIKRLIGRPDINLTRAQWDQAAIIKADLTHRAATRAEMRATMTKRRNPYRTLVDGNHAARIGYEQRMQEAIQTTLDRQRAAVLAQLAEKAEA